MKRLVSVGLGVASAGLLLLGTSAASASPGNVTCSGPVAVNVAHDLIVPAGGPQCVILPGVQVAHDVVVQPGGQLWDQDGTVGHDIVAINPQSIGIGGHDTPTGGSVGHDIIIDGVTGAKPNGLGVNFICNTTIGHDVAVFNSASTAAEFFIGDYDPVCHGGGITVGHDLAVFANRTQVDVSDQNNGSPPPPWAIGHDLIVVANWVAPIVESNTAAHNAICQSNHTTDGDGFPNIAGNINTCN
jgi:hypothetical protein